MEIDEAVKLLTSHIEIFKTLDDSTREMICKLAEYLYCWPLLLNLVRTQLYIYCTEWKMSPTKAMTMVTQKLSKSFTAFDQTSREKAVKICLDTSLNLFPEQHTKVLHYIILAPYGFGPYVTKDSVARTSKMTYEQFSTCIANLWSHGLIELIDLPKYPTNQCISCIGVHNIVAHYITETIPLQQLYAAMALQSEEFSCVDDIDDNDNNIPNSNVGIVILDAFLKRILFLIRLASLIACTLERILSDFFGINSQVNSDELTMENKYSKMNKDCTLIASLLADNKHSDAIEWANNQCKTHAALHIQKSFPEGFLDGVLSMESIIPFITLHQCIAVLTKLKASNEDISCMALI